MDEIKNTENDLNRMTTQPDATIEQLRAEVLLLQSQNAELQRDAMHNRSVIQLQKMQQNQMQQKLQMANHKAEQMLIKYNTLASSKLGRLALKIWDWQTAIRSVKVNGGIKAVIRWLLTPQKDRSKALHNSKMSAEQMDWVDDYIDRLARVADSNGCRYYRKLPHRIGLISDGFFYESISAAADFVYITPDNWEQELGNGLDAMLFVTAWRGLHEEWRGLGAVKDMEKTPMRMLALKILDQCKEKKIPTVFYSKEDPPNYEVFIEYAKHCDYIRTTARECIPRYVKECGNGHVQAVCFGINPVFHNPIGFRSVEKEKVVLFSGSWMLTYPDRCRELAVIFDGILDSNYGLHIIDRNYPSNVRLCFPEKYFDFSSPALPHDLLQKVHKLFDWAVNINSVKGSQTMFANRAYELQANGVLLLSNLSVGVNEKLPNVYIVQESSEAVRILDSMSPEERYERQIAGIRSVMTGETCFDRIEQLLAPLNLDTHQPERCVLVLAETLTDAVRESFECQSYPQKVLREAASVSAEELTQFDMVAWFDARAEYGIYYLEDMVNGFKYTACDYITKDAWYEGEQLHEGTEHDYVNQMSSKFRTVFWSEAFPAEFLLSVSGEQTIANGYSIDHFNYNAVRQTRKVWEQDYLLSVVIPVVNNGKCLNGKAFSSLRRSSLFSNMEILIVDGGSTDMGTLNAEKYLERTYGNVSVLRFNDGDKASVITLRNKGAMAAKAPYLAFLNPEDEAINDGYALMHKLAMEQAADMVVGNLYLSDSDSELVNLCNVVADNERNVAAEKITAMPYGIQAALLRTELVRQVMEENSERGIVEGAKRISTMDKSVVVHYRIPGKL